MFATRSSFKDDFGMYFTRPNMLINLTSMKTIVDGQYSSPNKTSNNLRILSADLVLDVLTMSKLDSGLLVITPVEVQLDSIARDAVKMFEQEAKASGIDMSLRLENDELKSTSVSLDPTRIMQVLIVSIVTKSSVASILT